MATRHGRCSKGAAQQNGGKAKGTRRPQLAGILVPAERADIASQTSGGHGLFRGTKRLCGNGRKERERHGRGDHERRVPRGLPGQWGHPGGAGVLGCLRHCTKLPVIYSPRSGNDDRHTGHRHPASPHTRRLGCVTMTTLARKLNMNQRISMS